MNVATFLADSSVDTTAGTGITNPLRGIPSDCTER
jgi:hypothetical protein